MMIVRRLRLLQRLRGAVVVVTAALGATAGPGAIAGAGAQQLPVVTEGTSDVAVDLRLSRLLAADPVIILHDTLVARTDTVHGSVLVLDATLVLEGVVTGDLVLVDAGAFVRPGAVVRGDLVNVAGGLYRSEISRVGGAILDLPTASYRVVREPDRIVIEATDTPSRLQLDGVLGVHVPTYDRVNGLTAVWGARYRLPRFGDATPSIHGEAGWQTERGEPTYGLSGRVRWLAMAVEGGHEKGWATTDAWIKGDLRNSLTYLWDGDDHRDYHQAERSWAAVRREFGDTEKRFYGVLGLRGQVEDAASLRGGDPWHLLSGDVRDNPPIDDGRTTSLLARFDMEWHGQQTDFEGSVEYEAAREWLEGQFSFDRLQVRGDWAMHALADHTLEIDFFVQRPLSGGVLPRQRWSFVGGSGTLRTVDLARYRGDRVVHVETKYIIPLPERLAVPLIGAPDLRLIHAAGMAWTEGEDPGLRQEVGVRIQFFGPYVRYMVDPTDSGTQELDIGLRWPFGSRYPWERR